MITACRSFVALSLTVLAIVATPAAASVIGDAASDRLLIADPSPALRAHLIDRGFVVEHTERLEALDLSLMTVVPPQHVHAAAALADLRAAFPSVVVALNDSFRLA